MPPFERKLSHSSLSSFRRCQMRYKWGYIDNLDPPPSPGQMFGSIGHVALGEWYRSMADPLTVTKAQDNALKAASVKLSEYEEKQQEEMPDLWNDVSTVLLRYFDWAVDNDDFEMVPDLIEHKFELKLGDFTLIGYIDGIVRRSNGSLWVLENKFNKQVRTGHLDLDPQISIYMLAARATGYDVRGAFYNVVRTTIKGIAEREPVVRLPVFRNNEGLEKIVEELVLQMIQMKKFHDEQGIFAYRNPTRDCNWDCGFYGACLAMNDDGDPTPVLRSIPLKDIESTHIELVEGE